MIKANHKNWSEFVFSRYILHLLKRNFYKAHLFDGVPNPVMGLPLIIAPNHSSWWDGFFVYLLNKKIFERKLYLMMLEEQLQKYRFFAKIGAYSINPHFPKSILESLQYSVSTLKGDKNEDLILCIFPQGELEPLGKRPLNYKRGLEWILQKYQKDVNLISLATQIEFLNEQRPEVFFLMSDNFVVNYQSFEGMEWLESLQTALLNDLASKIANREVSQTLLEGSRSVSEVFDSLNPFKNAN